MLIISEVLLIEFSWTVNRSKTDKIKKQLDQNSMLKWELVLFFQVVEQVLLIQHK